MKIRFIALTLTLLCASEAFANNYFIPNYYRNRRNPNAYSAVGWSNRKEVGVNYSVENTDTKTNGTKSGDEEETVLRPYLYYRTPYNLNVEAQILRTANEDQTVPATGPKAKSDTMDYNVGLGYELADTPLAFGLVLNIDDTKDTSAAGLKTDSDMFSAALGVGYRLEGDMYVGAGYTNRRTKATNTKEDTDHEYALGFGKTYGDRANPAGASEAVLMFQNESGTQVYGLTVQGLVNKEEMQYYASLMYAKADGAQEVSGYGLMLGMDYKFADFYIGPQFSWTALEFEVAGLKSKTNELVPSLEAGYRIDFFEAFLRYDLTTRENKLSGLTTGKIEDKGNTLTAGLAYKF